MLLVGLTGCEQEIVTEIGDSLTPKEETRVVLTMGIEDGEVFYLGESGCSKEEFMLYLTNMQNSYEEIYGEGLWDVSEDGGSMERRIKDNVAARIAQVKTMALLAEDYQVSLTEEEERLVQQAALEYFRSLNKNELDALSVTQETVAGIYRENLLAHNVYTYIIKDVNPEISDDEARNVEAAWVFVGGDEEDDEAKSLAINVKALADQGNDFDELITTYSDDKDLTHTFGKGQVDPAVEEAAFSLAEGQISGVITGADGYYVIKCLTTLDRKETDANKEKIVAKRKQEAFNDVYKNFAENLMQRLNEEAWEEIKMIHDPAVSTSSLFAVYDKYFPEE
ncbi:MAG: peptidylprolyl isomerase [Lachnospiraceae bacterium]|nr:peptidylprolyl isomerase [Lachnospiraceae bacterium]